MDRYDLNQLIKLTPDMICIADTDGYFKFLNVAWEKTLGFTLEELLSRPLLEFIHPDDHELTQREIKRQFSGNKTKGFVNRYRCKDGSYKFLEWRAIPAEGEKLFAIARDVTEKVMQEKVIKKSEKQLRTVLETLELIAVSLDNKGNITFANNYLLNLTGWKREEIMGKHWFTTFLPPEIQDKIEQEIFLKTIQTNVFPPHYQNEIVTKEGRRRLIRWNNTTFSDSQGNAISVTSIGEDITQRKQAENGLRKSEIKYRQIFEKNQAIKLIIDPEGGAILEVNKAACDYYGYSMQVMTCLTVMDINIAQPEQINLEMQNAKKEDRAYFNFTHRMASGELRDVEVYSGPINWGEKTALYSIVHDVTDRKRTEKLLQESESKYRSMMESMIDPVYICSASHMITYMNPAMIRRNGRDATGEICYRAIHNFDQECEWCVFDGKSNRNPIETTILSPKDGRHYRVKSMPISKDGFVLRMTILRDITEYLNVIEDKRKIEAQLLHSQKLDAVGTLAGGIAHDFNNILSVIIGFTELSMTDVEIGSEFKENLSEVMTASLRAKNLVNQILTFARQSGEDLHPLPVDTIVNEVLKFIRSTIPVTIEIKPRITSNSFILGDSTQVYQVLMNLCTNAAYAMEDEGGILGLDLKDVFIGETSHEAKIGLKPGNYIQLKVSDTGLGIPVGNLKSIFEPFFTTKPVGEGTGMGLATVHGIVESYGGKVTVDSELGKGTVFTIHFPIIKSEKVAYDSELKSLKAGKEHILFVDDEAPITNLISRLLKQMGYQVTTSNSSLEALELFQSKPNYFDLVISDMTMPNMTGDKLATELMKIRPEVPIILCTGYSRKIKDGLVEEIGVKAILNKPIGKADLAKVIRKVLDNEQG